MPDTAMQSLTLRRVSDGRLISSRTAIARDFFGRLMGLMGRSRLTNDECLYLPDTNGIHMFFMRFAIDCLFLGDTVEGGARPVIALRRRLPPWRGVVWYIRGARGVVELPAGTIDAADLQVGDLVRFDEPSTARSGGA